MKAYLHGGPADGKRVDVPDGQWYWREAISRPTTIFDYDPKDTRPNYDIADYKFSGYGVVTLRGEVEYLIFYFQGMEPA